MGILDKLFHRGDQHGTERAALEPEPECPHTALAPHWDNPQDLGKEELAVYTCESCGEKFPFERAKQLMDQPPAVLTNVGRSPTPHDDDGKQS